MNTFRAFDEAEGERFAALVGAVDLPLLERLRAAPPDQGQRVSVMRILSDALMNHLRPDWEPDPDGEAIDNLLGTFLKFWPIDGGTAASIEPGQTEEA